MFHRSQLRMTAGYEFSGEPETAFQFSVIDQAMNIQALYSFSLSPSITHESSAPPTTPSDDDWDETGDDDESSPGVWNDWDLESHASLPETLGRFNFSFEERTVAVDVDGGESFKDDGFFQFQELVSVMEGLVPKDSQRDSETILNFLNTRKYEKGVAEDDEDDQSADVCAICLCEFQEDETVATLQNCTHEYHGDCITQWLLRTNACPLCNQHGLKLP